MAAFRLVLDDDLDAAADRRTAKLLLPEELLLVVPLPVEEVLCGSVALVGELARFRPRIVCIIISLYLCFDFDSRGTRSTGVSVIITFETRARHVGF